MSRTKYIIVLLCLLIVPAVINVLMLRFSCIGGTCEVKDWIPFWGSYLGAIVTGIISFIILFRTIEANKKTTEKTIAANLQSTKDTIEANEKSLHEQLTFARGADFRDKASKCLSHLDLNKYTYIYLKFESGASAKSVSKELTESYTIIVEDLASFELEFAKRFPQFTEDYSKLAKEIAFMVGEMSAYVYKIPTKEDSIGSRQSALPMLKAMADNIKNNNEKALNDLYEFAKNLLLSAYS